MLLVTRISRLLSKEIVPSGFGCVWVVEFCSSVFRNESVSRAIVQFSCSGRYWNRKRWEPCTCHITIEGRGGSQNEGVEKDQINLLRMCLRQPPCSLQFRYCPVVSIVPVESSTFEGKGVYHKIISKHQTIRIDIARLEIPETPPPRFTVWHFQISTTPLPVAIHPSEMYGAEGGLARVKLEPYGRWTWQKRRKKEVWDGGILIQSKSQTCNPVTPQVVTSSLCLHSSRLSLFPR